MAAPIIPLNQIIPAMDRKDRDFYDNLSDDLKKKFSAFIMEKYLASVKAIPDYEHYYIVTTNTNVNLNLFDLSKHPKLQWLLLTTVSPLSENLNHSWIKGKPKPKDASTPIKKVLMDLFPAMKEDDIDILSKRVTKKELNQYLKDRGENK